MPDKRIIMHKHDRHPQHFSNQPKGEAVGWCSHNKHRGKLSVRMMKNHKCLAKNCQFFTRNENHPYWKSREQIKKTKKEEKRKARLAEYMEEEIKRALDNLRTR